MAEENFALQIASADRVVGWDNKHKPSVSLSGREARKLISAIASARQIEFPGGSRTGLWLRGSTISFYRGERQLCSVTSGGSHFRVNRLLHRDTSGVLKAFNQSFDAEFQEMKNTSLQMADEVLASPLLEPLRPWCSDVLSRHAAGEPVAVEYDAWWSELANKQVAVLPSWFDAAWSQKPARVLIGTWDQSYPDRVVLVWNCPRGPYGLVIGPGGRTRNHDLNTLDTLEVIVAPGLSAFYTDFDV